MSGFLKNLKALFIATDEELLAKEGRLAPPKAELDGEGNASEASTAFSRPEPSVSPASSPSSSSSSSDAGQVERKFLDILLRGLEEENQEGYDYLEFKQALRSLKNMEMDDATRYQSAFAVAKTMGATKERILDSGAFYLDVLKKEESQFMTSLTNQRRSRVEDPRQELEEADQWIKDKQAEIEKIQKAIEEKRAVRSNKEKAIQEAENKILKVKRDFKASLAYLSDQITNDISRVDKFLN